MVCVLEPFQSGCRGAIGQIAQCVLSSVMAGLDPAIQLTSAAVAKMGARVRPGHDGVFGRLDRFKPQLAVAAQFLAQPALGQHVIDMGDQFAGGEAGLVSVQLVLVKHDRHELR